MAVSVSDTGPGIPASEQQRIFGNFEQLDNSSTRVHGGSGLGLAISRRLIQLMGSDIDIHSATGEGATFSFAISLPVTIQKTLIKAPLEGRSLAILDKVVVVDDNGTNRNILMSMLQMLGVEDVHCAASATEALELLEGLQPALILTDIQMPVIDGYGFLEQVSLMMGAANKPMPVIIACTAETGENQRRMALDAGFDAYLSKPISGEALAGALEHLRFRITH